MAQVTWNNGDVQKSLKIGCLTTVDQGVNAYARKPWRLDSKIAALSNGDWENEEVGKDLLSVEMMQG